MKKEQIHFITGATGFVGKYLVDALAKEGSTVWVLARNEMRSPSMLSGRPRIVHGDITKPCLGICEADLIDIKNFDVTVWHLAANLSFLDKDREDVFNTNVCGTRNVVDFSNKYATTLNYMSTAYVCGRANGRIDEDSMVENPVLRNNYETSKYEAEKIVRDICNVPFVIFRPAIIIGDAYQGKAKGCTFGYYRFAFIFFVFKSWVAKMLKKEKSFLKLILKKTGTKFDEIKKEVCLPWLYVPCPRDGEVNLVPIDYVISSMIIISRKPEVAGKTFHLVQSNPPSYQFLLSVLLENLGYRKIKYISVPNTVFYVLFRILYRVATPWRKYLNSASSYMPYVMDRYNFSVDNINKYNVSPPALLSKDFLKKVNTYAEEAVFDTIRC